MDTPRHPSRRFATLFIVGLLLVPASVTLVPTPANALFGSTALTIKEYFLDAVVWQVKRAAVTAITKSTLNWINSGFKGSPAFVTNLRQNLLTVADQVASDTFDELTNTIIDSPYQDEIATAIRTGYYLSTGGQFYIQNPFTLNRYSDNPDAFLRGDFRQGGLNAFFATITNEQNNPYGAYRLALGELNRRIPANVGRELTQYNWAQGFKSFRGDCSEGVTPQTQNVELKTLGGSSTTNADGSVDMGGVKTVTTKAVALKTSEPCLDAGIRTPGALAAPAINEALGAGKQQLIYADEIDEIVGALFAQLVNKAFGATGLLGISQPESGGGRPYLDQASDPTAPTTGGGSTGGGTAATESQLSLYQQSWQTIASAADDALARCSSSSLAQAARAEASTAIAKATQAMAVLDTDGIGSQAYISIAPTQAEVMSVVAELDDEADSSLYSQLIQVKSCN